MIASMRGEQVDTSFSQALAQRVTVVRLVSDYSLGAGPWPPWPLFRDFDLLECLFGEPDLCWRSRVGMASQRNTLAIDHHHALCSLSPLGLSDRWTPFFAGKKLASMNDSSQSNIPLASNSERKALHISLRTSASSPFLRRRQQVEGCGGLYRKIFPPGSRLEYPEDSLEDQAIILSGATSFRSRRRLGNEGFDLLPLLIGQVHERVCSPGFLRAS